MTLTFDATARKVEHARMFIDGEWAAGRAGATFPTVDPNTGETIAEVPRGDSTDVDRAVAAAKKVAVEWQFTDAVVRAGLLRALAATVTEHADELARLEALDSGHYLAKAQELVGAIPLWLDYWAAAPTRSAGAPSRCPATSCRSRSSSRSGSPRTSCRGTTRC